MRERRYVKFRVDMYNDTKLKIIDRMPERDFIHYVWNRLVVLAGKVNREGDLYMSKNIPYTAETLAIEFNRDADQIEAALDVLIKLEMMELTEDKVYRVKNFAKHQNIKIKEKIEVKSKENYISYDKNSIKENKVQIQGLKNKECIEEKDETNRQLNKINIMPLEDSAQINSGNISKCDNKSNADIENGKNASSQHNSQPVILEMKKSQKTNKKNKKVSKKKIRDDIIGTAEEEPINIMEEEKEEELCCWTTGKDMSLSDGAKVVSKWGF